MNIIIILSPSSVFFVFTACKESERERVRKSHGRDENAFFPRGKWPSGDLQRWQRLRAVHIFCRRRSGPEGDRVYRYERAAHATPPAARTESARTVYTRRREFVVRKGMRYPVTGKNFVDFFPYPISITAIEILYCNLFFICLFFYFIVFPVNSPAYNIIYILYI